MREIKFRGKRLDNGEWVYGNIQVPKLPFAKWFMRDEGSQVEVDPNTVGQYTSLTDKNSREIFEGDIFKHMDSNGVCIVRVLWDECNARFIGIDQRDRLWYVGRNPSITVIGNIYDNPELLKTE